jgi:hypothetical protein
MNQGLATCHQIGSASRRRSVPCCAMLLPHCVVGLPSNPRCLSTSLLRVRCQVNCPYICFKALVASDSSPSALQTVVGGTAVVAVVKVRLLAVPHPMVGHGAMNILLCDCLGILVLVLWTSWTLSCAPALDRHLRYNSRLLMQSTATAVVYRCEQYFSVVLVFKCRSQLKHYRSAAARSSQPVCISSFTARVHS